MVVDERGVVDVQVVAAGGGAPRGVADIVAADPLEHVGCGVPAAVLAGHEADPRFDSSRVVAGEQLRVSAAAAVRAVRGCNRRRRPECIARKARARARARRVTGAAAPDIEGHVPRRGARPVQRGTAAAARQRGERASYRAPSRRPVAAVVVLLR